MHREKCESCNEEFEFHAMQDHDGEPGSHMEFVRFAMPINCECCGPEIDYFSGVRWRSNHMECDDCAVDVEDI